MAKKKGKGKGLMGHISKNHTAPMGGTRKMPKAPRKGMGQ